MKDFPASHVWFPEGNRIATENGIESSNKWESSGGLTNQSTRVPGFWFPTFPNQKRTWSSEIRKMTPINLGQLRIIYYLSIMNWVIPPCTVDRAHWGFFSWRCDAQIVTGIKLCPNHGGTVLLIWLWINTYRYIFSGMNIHLPAILMFTRGTRFWPIPISPLLCWECLFTNVLVLGAPIPASFVRTGRHVGCCMNWTTSMNTPGSNVLTTCILRFGS